ncbi:phosphonate metabolism transcriptional regulator PhnF [Vibrio barjaei]|jgi:GntR family phosphonate transport system transcriptional regulator|uniref:Phosphonate metabolism transcriptional regulator PhnF n=1 Tax=Vibrio barjaei TaxID=1676683 RepID=A0ABW7INA2_9VIBR|nr:phosphonate metabolism transcriptional regulator PhnF [Vibrio barjaei]MCG9789754.1 phosphonate metabolism transcriptional regulator PhnF [Vibrio mediterranei]MCY9870102.1 phosphonate metabolism transcriptional regulator PhnF [Vibrio barjaei]OIN26364.1 phosphonate metabolism transcriptional regulator PhnF [Vibrio barjaei]
MPVYLDIASVLEQEVRERYVPGDYLPPEGQLAQRFDVNRHTLRRAIDELVNTGMVQRHQGKGNMVIRQPSEYHVHSGAHFTKNLIEQGARPRCEVIQHRVFVAPMDIAANLGVVEGSKIIHIRTLRKTEECPRTIIDHYLSNIEWWSILKNYQSGSLHEFIKRGLDIELERKETRVGAKTPTGEECRLLQITQNTPILRVKTKNVIKGTDMVAEFSTSNSRSDATEIVMEH